MQRRQQRQQPKPGDYAAPGHSGVFKMHSVAPDRL
jgi:hypothetical protein